VESWSGGSIWGVEVLLPIDDILEKLDAVSVHFVDSNQPGVNRWKSPKRVKYLSGKRPPAFLAVHLAPCLSLLEIELVRICACQWSTNINRILLTHFSACFILSFFISTDLYVYIKNVVGRPGQRVRLNPNRCRPRGNCPKKLQCSTRCWELK
jgi:branched-subunit amino acid transport protein AzlD